jgi:spore germination protein KC
MRRKIFIFMLLMINMTILTGCWSYREIDKLSIVAGAAVDKSESGKRIFTFEIIDLHEGGRDTNIESRLLESEGYTIFDAVRNSLKFTAPRPYFGHMEVVIISQEIAKDGVIEILDFLNRDAEPRLTIDLLVSKEKTAKEILKTQSTTTEIRSFEIYEMLDAQKYLSKSPKVEVYQFINELPCEGSSPFLPAIRITETAGIKTMELSGTAVFKEDKLIGFLDEEESKYFLFIKDNIKGGVFALENLPSVNDVNISFEIFQNQTEVKPVYSDGGLSMNIETKTQMTLAEQGTELDFTSERGRLTIKKEMEESLKANIQKVIQRVQKDFAVDIFGFGSIVNAEMPSLWKEIGRDWNDIFVDLDVNVNTIIEIRDSGSLSGPIKVGR